MLNKVLVSFCLFAVATFAVAKNDFPAVSHDGLHLMPDTKLRAVYMKPGADLSQYDKIALLDAYVAFAKNWQRDHNEDETFDQRVSDKDMKEIRDRVAKEFAKEFTKVLSIEGGHEVVNSLANSLATWSRISFISLSLTRISKGSSSLCSRCQCLRKAT